MVPDQRFQAPAESLQGEFRRVPLILPQHDDVGRVVDEATHPNSPQAKVPLVVETAGVVEIVRNFQFRPEPDDVSVPVRLAGSRVQKDLAFHGNEGLFSPDTENGNGQRRFFAGHPGILRHHAVDFQPALVDMTDDVQRSRLWIEVLMDRQGGHQKHRGRHRRPQNPRMVLPPRKQHDGECRGQPGQQRRIGNFLQETRDDARHGGKEKGNERPLHELIC